MFCCTSSKQSDRKNTDIKFEETKVSSDKIDDYHVEYFRKMRDQKINKVVDDIFLQKNLDKFKFPRED